MRCSWSTKRSNCEDCSLVGGSVQYADRKNKFRVYCLWVTAN